MAFKWIATSALVLAVAPAQTMQRVELSEPHMGTMFRIVTYAVDEAAARVAIGQAFARAAELDQKLSDYKPDSELNQLCKAPVRAPVRVSQELMKVVAASQRISQRTNGAFDISMGPLTQLWRSARKLGRLPSAAEVAVAKRRTSYRKIHIDQKRHTITLAQAGMQLDLGGIAKGYAADEMLTLLARAGYRQSLVAASGDIRVGDAPPGRDGWTVELGNGEKLLLVNQAVSTAGADEQYVEVGGVRYSHILDPKTGVGLTNRLTVSVVAPTGIEADGWDTALCIMGKSGLKQFHKAVQKGRAIFQTAN